MIGYFYIFSTLFFTVYGQMILKWRLTILSFAIPQTGFRDVITSMVSLFLDPFILSGFASAFIASIFWMAAMTKFEITEAYPFMSLAPAIVFILGIIFLNETFTWGKVIGLLFIIVGLIVTVKY